MVEQLSRNAGPLSAFLRTSFGSSSLPIARPAFILSTVLTLAGLALGWWLYAEPQKIVLKADSRSVVDQGRSLYALHCASCHGANLEGQPNWRSRDSEGYLPAPPHDETGHTWHHADSLLFEITKYGLEGRVSQDYKSRMPGYAGVLTDSEIIAVLSFIKSQWPEKIQRRHDRLSAANR